MEKTCKHCKYFRLDEYIEPFINVLEREYWCGKRAFSFDDEYDLNHLCEDFKEREER